MAIKILFINNWGDSTKKLLEKYRYYTLNHDNCWGNIEAAESIDDAEYLIVMDGFPKKDYGRILTNKDYSIKEKLQQIWFNLSNKLEEYPKKIFFQREPLEIKKKNIKLSRFLFNGSYENHYHVCTWMVKIPFKELEKLQKPIDTNPLSVVVTNKIKTYGQRQRIQTIKRVSQIYNEIDVFGRGLKDLGFGSAYKGVLSYNDFCKFKGLYGYRYSLAFENSIHENYFTEKLIDCFLCWTKPIYWGCPNIDKYFPKESYSYVDIFDKNAPKIIIEEILKPVNYDAIKEARDLVLYKYNIWPSIERIINLLEDNKIT
jgi:hypothetical protein